MKLRTAAVLQMGITVIAVIPFLPIILIYRLFDWLNGKSLAFLVLVFLRVGNKLLLQTDEYKRGDFKFPNVGDWTAYHFWNFLRKP